jgi:hypothetical protein
MAKKYKPERYDEGAIRGKKVFLLGALPVLFFIILVGAAALVYSNYSNKMSVNDDNTVCNKVRRLYSNSLRAEWPCNIEDKGDYWLVSFNQSVNTGQAAAIMSFKYIKTTKQIEPAITID